MKSLASVLLLVTVPLLAQSAERPNVVLFLIDDYGARDVGCYGSTYYRTPYIDRLAAQGMRFTNGYAPCPVCSPTRAALMTGKYPQRFGITDWLPGRPDRPDQMLLRPKLPQELPLDAVTIAEALKPAGYVTAHMGKWHLGGAGFGPKEQGFDINIAGDHTGTPLSYFAPFKNNQNRFMPGLETAPAGEYLPDRLATEAEKFLDANKEKPFFLYLPHYSVHTPLRAKKEMIEKYKAGRPGNQGNPVYAAMVESMDEAVGRVLKKLDDLKLSERTLVIFTSDNGGLATTEGPNTPPTINSPLREGKGFLYEGGVRVPLIVRWPGVVKPGSTTDVPSCSIDIFPTIVAASGTKYDSKPDGVDLAPVLKGGTLERDALYWHYPHYSNQASKPGSAIRAGDYKLIEFFEDGRKELFDLKKDPSESRNLIAEKPDVAHALGAKLDTWRKAVGAKSMTPNPNFVPNPQAANDTITLHARTARVHGIQLRFEPLPHKNTLGFWTRQEDWAEWQFQVSKPGTFSVQVLQGCGKGSGGAEVELAVGEQKISFTVKDTGGFQNFESRDVGTVKLDKTGRFTISVRAKSKPGVAVMDLRQITLTPTP